MASTNSTDSDSILLNQIVNQGVNIYGSREKIRSALIEYAKKYLNLQDTDIRKTSYLAYLIDQISILSANHIFYDSTIYKEFFFTDAQFTESVYNLAKWIGYVIPKATPARLKVMFSIPLNQNIFTSRKVSFRLSPYFYVRSSDGIPFVIKSNTLNATSSVQGTIDRQAVQAANAASGQLITNNTVTVKNSDGISLPIYVSKDKNTIFFNLDFVQEEIILKTFEVPNDLSTNQFYNIGIDYEGQVSAIEVYVISPSFNQTLDISDTSIDGALDINTFNPNEEIYDSSDAICTWTKWEEAVNGIYTMSSKANQYCWIGGYNKGRLMFGNGVLGKQPPAGSIVAVKLHVTKGSEGNIIPRTITNGDSIYIDEWKTVENEGSVASGRITGNSQTIKYSLLNPAAAYGGDDLLTIPEIKQKAIVNLASKNRLVSDQDYDDIQTILENDLPINDCCPILKRSDIKVNEIMTFTTLNYITDSINEVVPTRNAKICLKNIEFDDDGKFVLMRNTVVDKDNSNVGDDSYLTIFNLTLNKNNLTADYDYILQNVDGSAVKMYNRLKENYWESYCSIQGNTSSFSISTNKTAVLNNNFPLDVNFNVVHTPSDANVDIDEDNMTGAKFFAWKTDRFQCKMITKWGNNDTYDCTAAYGYRYETETDDDGRIAYKSFGWTIDNYLDVPEGIQRFEFQLQCYAPKRNANGDIMSTDGGVAVPAAILESTDQGEIQKFIDGDESKKIIEMEWQTIRTYYTDIVIRRDLSNFMSSSISFEEPYEVVSLEDLADNVTLESNPSQVHLENIEDANTVLEDLNPSKVYSLVGRKLAKEVVIDDDNTFEEGRILSTRDIAFLYGKGIMSIYLYTGDTNCYIHNVPVILKKYYDDTIEKEQNEESKDSTGVTNNFELTVMQELIQNMHFNDRKMLTDFINVKFSDTYGPMYNLRYNKAEYYVESRYDNTPWWDPTTQKKPDVIVNQDYIKPASNASNITFIVNNHIDTDDIIFGDNTKDLQLNDYIGYIALRIVSGDETSGYQYRYQLIEPSRGMFIKVKDELDVDGYMKTLVWTGRVWKDVSEYTIPLEMKLKVEVDEKVVSKSDEALTTEIINALTTYFKDKIGIQKNIDRSEIIKVCRSINGVVYAELLTPEFDIRFDYEVKDLTQRQLIDYTPQYIGFRGKSDNESDYYRSSINVQIVRV